MKIVSLNGIYIVSFIINPEIDSVASTATLYESLTTVFQMLQKGHDEPFVIPLDENSQPTLFQFILDENELNELLGIPLSECRQFIASLFIDAGFNFFDNLFCPPTPSSLIH